MARSVRMRSMPQTCAAENMMAVAYARASAQAMKRVKGARRADAASRHAYYD